MTGGWETVKLSEVATVQSGSGFPDKHQGQIDQDIPFYKVSDMSLPGNEREMVRANNTVSDAVRRQLGASIFPKGSTIFPKIGGAIATNKKRLTTRECCVDNNVMGAIPKKGRIVGDFLFYFFLAHDLTEFANEAHLPSIRKTTVEAAEITLPSSLPEQRRIVAVLDEAFEGIAAAKANAELNLQNARAVFESHLQSVFSQRSAGWVEDSIGAFCDITHGYAFDGAEFSSDVPDGKPLVITPGNFTEDARLVFNERNTKRFSGEPPKAFRFEVGDLVVVMTDLSSKMKILGKPAFVETDNVLHNQRIGRVVFRDDRIDKRLLYYFMMTDGFLRSIKSSATGTMVKHTAPKRILNNLIRIPTDRDIQRDIIGRLDALRADTQRLESVYQQKVAALEALKKSLLHQAFTGQLGTQAA
ncbi:MAG: restriction endonuclease subunit S [Armatimonadetes bacterium]|nr:restriction endonuclease subunit S [Armatimonadota bacterium]